MKLIPFEEWKLKRLGEDRELLVEYIRLTEEDAFERGRQKGVLEALAEISVLRTDWSINGLEGLTRIADQFIDIVKALHKKLQEAYAIRQNQ